MLSRLCLFLAFFVLCEAATLLSPASCRNNVCPIWDYKDPSKWATLCPDFATCSSGSRQSPIDISGVPKSGKPAPLNFLYAPARVTLFNLGKALIFPVPEYTGVFTFNNIVYSLSGAQFHSPSEHTINGTKFDLEIQLVHGSLAGPLVVSLLYNVGVTNPVLEAFWSDIPKFSNCSCGNGRFEPWMGESCDEGSQNSDSRPNACRRNCKWFSCGDSVIDAGEGCDNGNRNSDTTPNSCRTGCVLPRCGDQVVDTNYGEQCDDGNNFNGDGCSSSCTKENLCGNGVVDFGEGCDDGLLNSDTAPNACRTNCTVAHCGDGVVDNNEECDPNVPFPSFSVQAKLCRQDCTIPTCGDGVLDDLLGEECDEQSSRCEDCKLVCGNGRMDDGEECDRGVKNSNIVPNACRTNCQLPECGDAVTDSGEECDDGGLNGTPGGRCSSTCKILCGNGVTDAGEDCDAGEGNSDTTPNACRQDCSSPSCGDGVTDTASGEECDTAGATEFCTLDCKRPYCGDGMVSPTYNEECDDGNTESGDGCNAFCQKECGNGVFDGFEECDNGPLNSDSVPDACRLNCIKARCGDGIIDSWEECDDGERNSNSSNSCRVNCKVPICGDGVLDTASGEICDNGELNNDLLIDGCSTECVPNQCRQSALDAHVDFSKLFPPQCDAGYYTYTGSMTMPPCIEGVQWIVFEQVGYLSPAQLARFQSLFSSNSRPTQPLGKRLIHYPTTNGQRCGNGIREGTEECDDPKGNSDEQPNRCRKNCKLPSCGDNVVDCGEECDGGPVCTADCTIGTGASTNKTVVNMFFKDLIPYNYFCCNAAKPDSTSHPCPRCYQQQ